MRRAVVAVTMAGFTFGGIGTGLAHQSVIFGASPTADVRPAIKNASLTAVIRPVRKTVRKPAGKSAHKTNKKTAEKTIRYQGVEFNVPASWPVYWLNQDPRQCVRYDTNAVYVGTPGPNQDCPAGLLGRADTISIGAPASPLDQAGPTANTPANTPANLSTPAQTEQRAALAGHPAAKMSVATGTILQNPDLAEFEVVLPASAPRIQATYGNDPALVKQSLATVRQIRPQSAALGGAKPKKPANPAWPTHVAPPTGIATTWIWPAGGEAPAPQVTPTPTPSPTPVRPVTPSPTPPVPLVASAPQAGFDTCTAPSLPTMKAWRAKYAATAIYIGGQMVACGTGNLSASWVRQAEAMGWSLMPTFVGLQAPCNSFSGKINPSQAAAQGTAAANQAVGNAQTFGLGVGSPIYYDMEAYDHTNAGCRTAVLTFLDAWDRQVQARGYVSGVYSSADAAIIDLQTTTTIAGHPLAEPQAVWIALWDNANNLSGTPYVTSAVWPAASRSKQYQGNRVVSVGGISLDIDADWVNGPVAHG